jgi:hypothetical protein
MLLPGRQCGALASRTSDIIFSHLPQCRMAPSAEVIALDIVST